MISGSFFHVFIVNNWGKCPLGMGFYLVFIGPGGGAFWTLFAQGVENSPIKKISQGMVRLGIDWYIITVGGRVQAICGAVWIMSWDCFNLWTMTISVTTKTGSFIIFVKATTFSHIQFQVKLDQRAFTESEIWGNVFHSVTATSISLCHTVFSAIPLISLSSWNEPQW